MTVHGGGLRVRVRSPARAGPVIEGEFERLGERGAADARDERRPLTLNGEGVAVDDANMLATPRERMRGWIGQKKDTIDGRRRQQQPGNAWRPAGRREHAADRRSRVLGQYIKDLSFENPNVRKLFENPGSSSRRTCASR